MNINLIDKQRKDFAKQLIDKAPEDHVCIIKKKTRSLDQSAKFHAMIGYLAKHIKYMDKELTPTQWKVLFISGHAIATGLGAEIIPGLEGEFVNIRESSAQMSVSRMASVIEYVYAYGSGLGLKFEEPSRQIAASPRQIY